jgi:hypothetical protein
MEREMLIGYLMIRNLTQRQRALLEEYRDEEMKSTTDDDKSASF